MTTPLEYIDQRGRKRIPDRYLQEEAVNLVSNALHIVLNNDMEIILGKAYGTGAKTTPFTWILYTVENLNRFCFLLYTHTHTHNLLGKLPKNT
jgi:type I site-specific restriction endonuclease